MAAAAPRNGGALAGSAGLKITIWAAGGVLPGVCDEAPVGRG